MNIDKQYSLFTLLCQSHRLGHILVRDAFSLIVTTMASLEDLAPHLYHEKQQAGSMLCAQHALNNLLRKC